MWTKLTIEDGSFLLKRNADKDNLHRIQLTDFITLWFEDIYENALLKRCKVTYNCTEVHSLDHETLLVPLTKTCAICNAVLFFILYICCLSSFAFKQGVGSETCFKLSKNCLCFT